MLINIENAEKEFLKYTKSFNQEDDKVIRKTSHSLRVKEISRKIAEAELESNEKNIKIIKFYKNKLVEFGIMRQLKDKCKTIENIKYIKKK